MPQKEFNNNLIVVVKDEGVIGVVVEYGPHVSTVVYCINGLLFEEIMENEEFEPLEVD